VVTTDALRGDDHESREGLVHHGTPPSITRDPADGLEERTPMNSTNKAVVSLTTGLEDPERVTVAFLVAVAAAESGRPTLMFCTKEAVRLAMDGVAIGVACNGCPPLPDLVDRYVEAGGEFLVCPICVDAKGLQDAPLIKNATLGGTLPMWEWIGDDGATTFSY
jgi:predicted peroxiredoxin